MTKKKGSKRAGRDRENIRKWIGFMYKELLSGTINGSEVDIPRGFKRNIQWYSNHPSIKLHIFEGFGKTNNEIW